MDRDAILYPEVESRGDVVAKRVLCDTARPNRTSFMSIRCRPRDSVRIEPFHDVRRHTKASRSGNESQEKRMDKMVRKLDH